MVNIVQILQTNKISFVTHGQNVARGHVNINCIMCGDDPSYHLGIDLNTGWWGCWRSSLHRGKNIFRLFKILGIYVNNADYSPLDYDLLADGKFFEETTTETTEDKNYTYKTLPQEFVPIGNAGSDRFYRQYLQARGFDQLDWLISEYNLKRCRAASSKWNDRLICPSFIDNEVSWTGRTINPYNPIRYLSPARGEARNIKSCIANYNALLRTEGKALVITEGFFDSLKVDAYGRPDFRATCLFGMSLSEAQLRLLQHIIPNFAYIFLALDQDTYAEAIGVANKLDFCSPIIIQLPSEVKDFGDMSIQELWPFLNNTLIKYTATIKSGPLVS